MPTPITLKVFRGNELVRTEQFTREIIKIGRLATAHLVLDDEKISRIHSVIEVAPDGAISIIDMGSAEGTFVNGRKVSRGAIRPGDQITLGGLRIVLQGAEAPVAPSPANEAQNVAVAVSVAPAPAAAAPVAALVLPVGAWAQTPPPGQQGADTPPPKVEYEKKTVINFEDDTIEGDLKRPDGEYVEARQKVDHSNLIKIREDWREKVMQSSGDLQ